MQPRGASLRVLAGLVVAAALCATAQPGWSRPGAVGGAWHGRLISPQEIGNIPTSAYPTAKLVVTNGSIVAEFHGRTQAAHDAENVVSTCRVRYRHAADAAGWRVYVQVGKPVIVGPSTGGPPDLSPCGGPGGGAARVRVAGSSLLAELTTEYRRGEDFGPGKLRGFLKR